MLRDVDMSGCYNRTLGKISLYLGQPIVLEPGSEEMTLVEGLGVFEKTEQSGNLHGELLFIGVKGIKATGYEDQAKHRMTLSSRFFGDKAGSPLPTLTDYPTGKHTKGNKDGLKAERPVIRVALIRDFEIVDATTEIVAVHPTEACAGIFGGIAPCLKMVVCSFLIRYTQRAGRNGVRLLAGTLA